MKRVPVMYLIPPVIAALIGVMFWAGLGRDDRDSLPSTLVGQAAPVLSLDAMEGLEPVTDEMLRAPGVKLVNFWASWCGPCRVEHPGLMALKDLGIPIIGVNFKDRPAAAIGFLDELGSPYVATGADPTGRNAIEWGVYGVPETFVIDGNGIVVLRFAGPITSRVMQSDIMPAIENAEGR